MDIYCLEKTKEEWEDYYLKNSHDKNSPPLKFCSKPCQTKEGKPDCAVVTNFYTEYAVGLSYLNKEQQEWAASRWYCHNDRTKACRGLKNFLAEINN